VCNLTTGGAVAKVVLSKKSPAPGWLQRFAPSGLAERSHNLIPSARSQTQTMATAAAVTASNATGVALMTKLD
jgi:hypothetical protein